jgi:hypothetical protein
MSELETTVRRSVTSADLEWWREKITALDWVFAVTYADGAPHEYVADRTEGMSPQDFVRAARVIHTFGEPQKFYKWTRIYLVHDGWKYWTMDDDLRNTTLVNRGRASHVYGVQNAPQSASMRWTAYDGVATYWDAELGTTREEREGFHSLAAELGDFTKRRVLDLGCGTGLALDLGITEPVRYTGIEPSQAMLNQLVRKHPLVARIEPMDFADARLNRVLCGTKFDLVVALGGSASYLTGDDLAALPANSTGRYLLSAYADGEAPSVSDLTETQLREARIRLHAFAAESGGRVEHVGRFDVAVIRQ